MGFLPPPGGPIAPTKFESIIVRKSPMFLRSYQPIYNKKDQENIFRRNN